MRNTIAKTVSHLPTVKEAGKAILQFISSSGMSKDDVEELIQVAEFALKNPDKWSAIRARVVQMGLVPEAAIPAEYKKSFVAAMIAALHIASEKIGEQSPLKAVSNALR